MTTETWVRKELEALANGPVVRRAYTLVAFSPLGLALQLGRYPDGSAKVICEYALTADAHARIDGWLALLRRNAPGDREAAIWDMGKVFEQVIETPLSGAMDQVTMQPAAQQALDALRARGEWTPEEIELIASDARLLAAQSTSKQVSRVFVRAVAARLKQLKDG